MRIRKPLKSPIVLIFFLNQPPICGASGMAGRGTMLKAAYVSSISLSPSPWYSQAEVPSGFIPNGMVPNHSMAGSRSDQYCGDAMYPSMVPLEVASKHSNAGTIWPAGATSMRKRPPLISSTTLASRSAFPWSWSSTAVQLVDMRHWIFGWAMTLGASTIVAAATAVSAPLAVTRNRRRSVVIEPPSPRHELVVGALGHAVPRAHQRLELCEGGVDLAGHGRLLRFLLHDLGGDLPELAQHGCRKLDDLDGTLELRLESLERDGILQVEIGRGIRVHGCRGVVEHALQVDRQPLIRFLVEAELIQGAGLVPARVVVVPRGLVQAELHVVVRPDPLGRIDRTALERSVDIGGRGQHRGGADARVDLAAEIGDAHPKPLEISDRANLLPEPPAHLRGV